MLILDEAAAAADKAIGIAERPVDAMHAAAETAWAAITANGVDVECQFQRTNATALLELTAAERAELFERPTIVSGLTDGWAAFKEWSNPHNFSRRVGDHRIMAKRSSFSYVEADRLGADLANTEVYFSEAIELAASEHLIVLDETQQTKGEWALQAELTRDYTTPPVLETASALRVFSFGGGMRGVEMMQHAVAWLATVAGAKLWSVAPPTAEKPSDVVCREDGAVDQARAVQEGVSHCLLMPGEIIVVPDNWWHATCNLLPYTVAIGAQLWVEPKAYDAQRQPPPPIDVPAGTRGLNPYQRSVVPTLLDGQLLGRREQKPAPSRVRDEL